MRSVYPSGNVSSVTNYDYEHLLNRHSDDLDWVLQRFEMLELIWDIWIIGSWAGAGIGSCVCRSQVIVFAFPLKIAIEARWV